MIDLALEELRLRRIEAATAEKDGSWEAWARMKRARSLRRRDLGWSRSNMKAWLDIAERELASRAARNNAGPKENMNHVGTLR